MTSVHLRIHFLQHFIPLRDHRAHVNHVVSPLAHVGVLVVHGSCQADVVIGGFDPAYKGASHIAKGVDVVGVGSKPGG